MANNETWSVILRLLNGMFDNYDSWFEKLPTVYTANYESRPGLSRFNHGVAVTGSKATTKNVALSHTALFGPTSSGKTHTVILSSIVSLARGRSSLVINDVKGGEIYGFTSGYLASLGYTILRYDFRNSAESECFNPLDFLKTESDIYLVALLIFSNSGSADSKGDKFWEHSSVMLLSLLIKYLFYHQDRKYLTMQNVLRLLERMAFDPKAVYKLFSRITDESLINELKATLSMPEKTLASVVVSLRAALRLWQDRQICATTSSNSFQLQDLRDKPVAVYVCTPMQDLSYTKPITALFFNALFNFVLSGKTDVHNRSIFFILDEFAAYVFPEFPNTIATIRGMNAGVLIAMQDELALTARYNSSIAHLIKTNCNTQIYMPGQPLHTCKELSQILGKFTYETEKGEKTRELATPDEIRISDRAIILIKNLPPIRARLVAQYNNVWLRNLIKMPPYMYETKPPLTPNLLMFE